MRRSARLLLAISGLVPILFLLGSPSDPMLLVYSFFVLALFLRPRIVRFVQGVSLRPFVKLVLLIIGSGMMAECLAWANNYLARNAEPALFHPQLIPDLILGIGFYGGWALAWTIILRRYRFSLASVFMTTGFLGVAIEQDSQVLISILQTLPTNPLMSALMAVYVFVVYGSVMGLADLAVEGEFHQLQRRSRWFKYPAVLLLMFVGARLLILIVVLAATPLGLIPEPRLIWEYPLF